MKILNEDDQQRSIGHKLISPELLLNQNENEIEELLIKISKKYNVPIKDAAFSLAQTLKNIVK